MSQSVLTLELPDDVYDRVRRAAKGMKQPVEQALVTIVRAALPSLEKIPHEYRKTLQAMEDLSDEQLRQTAERSFAPAKQRQLTNLLAKKQREPLTDRERRALTKLRREADAITLERAYASLLLKYRGHPVPNGAEATR